MLVPVRTSEITVWGSCPCVLVLTVAHLMFGQHLYGFIDMHFFKRSIFGFLYTTGTDGFYNKNIIMIDPAGVLNELLEAYLNSGQRMDEKLVLLCKQ